MKKLFETCLILSCLILTPAEHFRSHHDVQGLLQTEVQVVSVLELFIKHEKERINGLETLFNEYKEMHWSALQDRNLINPINTFLLIRRLTITVHEITAKILEEGRENIESVGRAIQQVKDSLKFPDYDDFVGAKDGIIRLQDTYGLSSSDIADGELGDIEFDVQLSASDCVALGKQSHDTHYHDLAIEWMTEAFSRIHQSDGSIDYEDPASRNLALIYEILANASEREGFLHKAVYWNNKLLELDPNHQKAREQKFFLEAMAEETIDGVSTRLARLKQEELYLDPRIIVYRDVVNDDEIEELKELSRPEFKHTIKEDYRVAKWSWLYDGSNKVLRQMTLRVEDMTGYTMQTAEQFSVINYGIGGHYEPHYDWFGAAGKTNNQFGNGNRILTTLFYLSDVWRGGGTVFPQLNLTVWPEKGSALVFWNLNIDGSGNTDTQHAACPVLVGSKWVANRWIHEHGQELHNPCGLNETEAQTEHRQLK